MNLYENKQISLNDYLEIREKSEELLEYIDGIVYTSPSPSTKHQRISRKLLIKFDKFLDGIPVKYFMHLLILN